MKFHRVNENAGKTSAVASYTGLFRANNRTFHIIVEANYTSTQSKAYMNVFDPNEGHWNRLAYLLPHEIKTRYKQGQQKVLVGDFQVDIEQLLNLAELIYEGRISGGEDTEQPAAAVPLTFQKMLEELLESVRRRMEQEHGRVEPYYAPEDIEAANRIITDELMEEMPGIVLAGGDIHPAELADAMKLVGSDAELARRVEQVIFVGLGRAVREALNLPLTDEDKRW